MKQIDVTLFQKEPLAGHTSKGDQPKWQVKGLWYKQDCMGYEALAEVLVSRMLARSTVSEFVSYDPVMLLEGERCVPGCVCPNFRARGEILIPLERLHRAYRGVGLAQTLAGFSEAEERIVYTVEFTEKVTGLAGFGAYLSTVLELDSFILNEDRHTNNLAVLRSETTGAFRLCPLFDHGLSLLSDLRDYPLDKDLYRCISSVEAKPFSREFSRQAEAASALYGSRLHFDFDGAFLDEQLALLAEYYPASVTDRVRRVVREQMRKHSYLF